MAKAQAYLEGYWQELGHATPHLAGLATHLGVSRKTLYNWRDANEEFLHILDSLMAVQESTLWNNGLNGTFQPTLVKLMLTKHGYSDRQEVSGVDGGPVEIDTENRITIEVVKPDA